MANENKSNLRFFEAQSMRELYDGMRKWEDAENVRLLSVNIHQDSGKFCCIALTSPTEVVITSADGKRHANVSAENGSLCVMTDLAPLFAVHRSMPQVEVFVLRARRDIPAGTVISDLRKWFKPGGAFAPGSEPPESHTFASADEGRALIGQVVRRALAKGEFVRRGDIGPA